MATGSMSKGPGKSYREGLSLDRLFRMFPTDEAAEAWFTAERWPDGPYCPHCGSRNIQCGIAHPTMTHRCRDCPKRRMFSLKTGTVMQGSPLGYRTWLAAIYLVATNLKGVSSMKLHRDLGISQKSAWYLAHRIREAWKEVGDPFAGPVEADEAYIGGKRKNMPKSRREAMKGAGSLAGKTIVAGAKDRRTNKVSAAVVEGMDGWTPQSFVEDRVIADAKVYTDEHASWLGLIFHDHESVNHSKGEYVRGDAGTQGIESFWAMLKRAHTGTFHKISPKHMDRYVTEFAGRHNDRQADTLDRMGNIVRGMIGRRIGYGRPDRVVGARGSENPDGDDQGQAGGPAQALLLPAEQGGDGGRHRHRHHARGSPARRRVRREDRIRRKCLIGVVVTLVYKPRTIQEDRVGLTPGNLLAV